MSRDRLLTVSEALERVLQAATPLPPEEVPFREAAGRALSADVVAPFDMPPFDRSAMDGYAVRSADAGTAGVTLEVIGEIPAGHPGDIPVGPGQAARIMTGAPIPPGADAVQMVERVEALEEGHRVRLAAGVIPGENVRHRGEEFRAGSVVLRAGIPIRAAETALLATLGIVRVPARRAPRVALLATGDELVEPDRLPLPHQIRNSNAYALESVLKDLRLPSIYLGIAPDEPAALAAAVRRGLEADVFCLSGGVSVGDYDFAEDALRGEGVEVLFHGVAVKPGKPLLFGRKGATLVFGLPGNPVSSLCDFSLFAVPALRRMLGFADPRHREVEGVLIEEIRQKPGREWYAPARAEWRDGAWRVAPVPTRGSADLAAVCRANCWLIVPAEVSAVPAGSKVGLLLWERGF